MICSIHGMASTWDHITVYVLQRLDDHSTLMLHIIVNFFNLDKVFLQWAQINFQSLSYCLVRYALCLCSAWSFLSVLPRSALLWSMKKHYMTACLSYIPKTCCCKFCILSSCTIIFRNSNVFDYTIRGVWDLLSWNDIIAANERFALYFAAAKV